MFLHSLRLTIYPFSGHYRNGVTMNYLLLILKESHIKKAA